MAPSTDTPQPAAATRVAPCQWLPVYVEPVAGSGERLTVAVAAQTVHGAWAVQRTLDAHAARCMYGPYADNVCGFIDLIESSLVAHLRARAPLADWRAPLADGVFIGPLSDAYDDNPNVIASVGATLTSSIAARRVTLADTNVSAAPERGDEWTHQIRDAVIARRVDWAIRFNRPVVLRAGAPVTHIGYLGNRLAAQFGRLVPGRGLIQSRRAAKSYVTDLQLLRDREQHEALIQRPYYELMLWLPDANNLAFSATERDEALAAHAELEAFGANHALRVVALHDGTAAAERILRVEEPA